MTEAEAASFRQLIGHADAAVRAQAGELLMALPEDAALPEDIEDARSFVVVQRWVLQCRRTAPDIPDFSRDVLIGARRWLSSFAARRHWRLRAEVWVDPPALREVWSDYLGVTRHLVGIAFNFRRGDKMNTVTFFLKDPAFPNKVSHYEITGPSFHYVRRA